VGGTDHELAVFDGTQWSVFTAATSGLVSDGIASIVCVGSGRIDLPSSTEARPGPSSAGWSPPKGRLWAEWRYTSPGMFRGRSFSVPRRARQILHGRLRQRRPVHHQGCPDGSYRVAIKRTEKGKPKWYSEGESGECLRRSLWLLERTSISARQDLNRFQTDP